MNIFAQVKGVVFWRRREVDHFAKFELVTSVSAAFLTDRNLGNKIVSVIKMGCSGTSAAISGLLQIMLQGRVLTSKSTLGSVAPTAEHCLPRIPRFKSTAPPERH
jgi:hypothetical protein